MRGQRFWVHHGKIEPQAVFSQQKIDQEDAWFRSGGVRLTTGDLGTEVKWVVNSPCVTSLLNAMQWLNSVRAPIILRFFAVGWFEEVYREAASAAKRIEQVLARGDRHFTSRVFIREADQNSTTLPSVLLQAIKSRDISQDYSVDCTFDENSNMFRVERVGAKSAIGRVWGTYTSSHPCQSVGSYGDPVNATYEDVLRSNKPRYDHVLAALRLPDNALHWVPYHRVVYPRLDDKGNRGVTVVSQIAKVDIQVL
jgi:hypothetical protein